MKRIRPSALLVFFAAVLAIAAQAQKGGAQGHWVAAWTTAVHAPLAFPGTPPSPVFNNQTVRMVVRPTIGGDRIRILLSNAYGTSALAIGSAHVALVKQGGVIVPGSDHALTFGGETSVAIPPGAPILSDPVGLRVAPFQEVAVSLYLPGATAASTVHARAQHETYISGPGNFTTKDEIPNPAIEKSWFWLAELDVLATNRTAAIVAFGDSITDGAGAKLGEYDDWPNLLARRLADAHRSRQLAVVNEGLGGNRLLNDGAGVNALARFDRDVLSLPGVTDLIVLEGINDIGWPHWNPAQEHSGHPFTDSPYASQTVTAQQLIQGLEQIIDRAHEHGIRVIGATLTPFEGDGFFTADGEAVRQQVNHWIRTGGAFDGIIDFDAAVRDPNHPARFREEDQWGDYLHPNSAGYKAMADAIDLSLFGRGRR
jgi:lysophospholipase L1-like esterase